MPVLNSWCKAWWL